MKKKSQKYIFDWFLASQPQLPKEMQPGLLDRGRGKLTYDPSRVKFDEFGEELCRIYSEFDEQGYEVIETIPLITGESRPIFTGTFHKLQTPDYLGEEAYGITRGMMVIGRLKQTIYAQPDQQLE